MVSTEEKDLQWNLLTLAMGHGFVAAIEKVTV